MSTKLYDKPFSNYVAELKAAKKKAENWWESLLKKESKEVESIEEAEQRVRPRWPMGPCSHPYVIAVFRQNYLKIEEINVSIREAWKVKKREEASKEADSGWGVEDEDERETIIEPIYIVWERLEREKPDLAQFIHPLVSVEPIGFDFGAPPVWNEEASKRPPVKGLTIHNVQKGIKRLLSAPRDLEEAWPRPEEPIPKSKAARSHLQLFESYDQDLKKAVDEAVYSWSHTVSEIQKCKRVSKAKAVDLAYDEFLAGPANSPYVIWAVRKYWLECEALNKNVPQKNQCVPPEVFLLHWLLDGKHEDEVQVLSQLPFWPIGLDKEGNWV